MNSIDSSRILLIGGAGFVGSHIVDQLIDEGPAEIRVLDNFVRGSPDNLAEARARAPELIQTIEGTMTDTDQLHEAIAGVDYVIHLAALWLGECVNNPRAAMDVNVGGTYNVVEACRDLNVSRVVYSSSASVYGNALSVPMTEDHPFNNRTMYGATKIAGEQFFRAFNDMHELDYVGLRYMNIYGPRMDDKGTYVSVIVKVLDRIDQGLPPLIFGDGSQTYDFIHVGDVARANVLALQSGAKDEFFNIGTGVATSINELVHLLLELTGSDLQPEYRTEATSYVTHRLGSTEKAESMLGFQATTSLRDGLQSIIDWRRSRSQEPVS